MPGTGTRNPRPSPRFRQSEPRFTPKGRNHWAPRVHQTNSSLHRATSGRLPPTFAFHRSRRPRASGADFHSPPRFDRVRFVGPEARGRRSPGSGPRPALLESCRIVRERNLMDTARPKTIFITGATGLVGGHAVEEALHRGHRVRALVRSTSDTRMARPVGRREGPRRPGRCRVAAAGRRGGRLGFQLRGQGGRLGHARGIPQAQRRCPAAAPGCGHRGAGGAASFTSARWVCTRDAIITGPTRLSRPPPARLTPTRAPRPRPRPWS